MTTTLPDTPVSTRVDTAPADTPAAMTFSILQERLAKAASTVVKAIDPRPQTPALGNILLEATGDHRLRVVGSNAQMSITVWTGAKVDRAGAITLPAKTLTDLVGRLAKERVDMTLDANINTVAIHCEKTDSQIKGMSAATYPPVRHSDELSITLLGGVLKSMILQTVFACAKEDNRPALTGGHVLIENDTLTLAAADGYRLAVRTTALDKSVASARRREFILPARALLEVARLIDDDNQPVSISLPNADRVVTVRLPNIDVSTQIVEARFPDYSALIPKRQTTRAIVSVDDLLKTAQIAEIFAKDDAHSGRFTVKPFRPETNTPFDFGDPAHVSINGRSAERGDGGNHLVAEVDGDPVTMHFDIRFIIEVLDVMETERVVFECAGAETPGVWRQEGNDAFTYVLMPMTR